MNNKLQQALANNRGLLSEESTKKTKRLNPEALLEKFSHSRVFLVFPILLFEILVCYLGFQFYRTIGFDNFSAFSLSFATECFYMYFSSKRGPINLLIRVMFLTVSIFTLSYNAYTKDANLVDYKNNLAKKGTIITDRLRTIERDFTNLEKERALITKEMEVFIENEMITRGNDVLKPRRIALNNAYNKLITEKKSLENRFENYSKTSSSLSINEQLSILTIRTLITILVFSLIQIAICISLPDVIDSLKFYLGINSTDNI